MQEGSSNMLFIIAGIVVACVIIGFGFYIVNKGKASGSVAVSQMDKITNSMSEANYTDNDGKTVSGAELISIVSTIKDDQTGIAVETLSGQKTKYGYLTAYNYTADPASGEVTLTASADGKIALPSGQASMAKAIQNMQDKSSVEYVNATGQFKVYLLRDKNGTIAGLAFKQV